MDAVFLLVIIIGAALAGLFYLENKKLRAEKQAHQASIQEARELEIKLEGLRVENQTLKDQESRLPTLLQNTLANPLREFYEKQTERSLGNLKNTSQMLLQQVTKPLEDKLKTLGEAQERIHTQHGKLESRNDTLEKTIENLGSAASSLTNALTKSSKAQGDFGEWTLERLLEFSGLAKGLNYEIQESYVDADGETKRPDVVIYLPGKRAVVIDSKVSLTSYFQYVNADNDEEQKEAQEAYMTSVKNHMKALKHKKYEDLAAKKHVDIPGYVLMFTPIEGAHSLAVQGDSRLMERGLDDKGGGKVIFVGPTILMCVLRTFVHMWKQEDKEKNAQEIARLSADLYDKVCTFMNDLLDVGKHLESARKAQESAVDRLVKDRKNEIKGLGTQLKSLGVTPKKNFDNLIDSKTDRVLPPSPTQAIPTEAPSTHDEPDSSTEKPPQGASLFPTEG